MTNLEQIIKNRIGANKIIACYHKDGTNSYFSDLRGEEGDVITIPGYREIEVQIPCNQSNLSEGEFYTFDWHVEDEESLTFVMDGEAIPVDKKDFLSRLFNVYARKHGKDLTDSVNFQNTILGEVTGAEHTYIYELLQNANDYPCKEDNNEVSVKFILTKNYLLFLHSGSEFNLRNIVGICSINQGEKKKNTETIGYKGIGFKTVFVNNEYVYLRSGEWKLRFDKEFSESDKGECAWTLMPIHTDDTDLDPELSAVLQNIPNKYRVQFALKHKSDAKDNIPQLQKVFSDDQILLFIPHVFDAEVYINGSQKFHVSKDKDKWKVDSFKFPVPADLKDWVNQNVNSGNKIPEKFKEIENIGISFAVCKEGNKVIPVENARIYNYLPTELQLGFKFLVNADFVPNAARNGLHDVKWNNDVMRECGATFVQWFASFLEIEGQWELNSVFSLIPDFRNSSAYVQNCFRPGFLKELKRTHCIPYMKDGKYGLALPNEIIRDAVGVTSGDDPLFTDEEFYKFTGTNRKLIHKELRQNPILSELFTSNSYLKTECDVFHGGTLANLCTNPSFHDWLNRKENNIRFLRFVLSNEWMVNLVDYKILLTNQGDLDTFANILLDIDEYVEDIPLLSSKLRALDHDVREAISDIPQWNNFIGRFKKERKHDIFNVVIRLYNEEPKLFHLQSNNIGFIHLLTILGENAHDSIPYHFPFLTDTGEFEIEGKTLYIKDDFGIEFSKQPWVDKKKIHFISDEYFVKDGDKVKEFLADVNLKAIDASSIYRRFLVPEPQEGDDDYIISKIKDKDINISFYRYLALTVKMDTLRGKFTEKMKKRYTLFVSDNNKECMATMDSKIYFKSEDWETFIDYDWLPNSLCMAISDDYTNGLCPDDAAVVRNFFQAPQIVQSLTIGVLGNTIKGKDFDEICKNITSTESSKNFLYFLFVNRKQIFKGEQPTQKFSNIPICIEGTNELFAISSLRGRCYFHTLEMDEFLLQDWTEDIRLNVCDSSYNDLFATADGIQFFSEIGIYKFSLIPYILKHILAIPQKFSNILSTKEKNLAFHRYMYKIHNQLSGESLNMLKKFPIFLSSPDRKEGIFSEVSTNHFIPSDILNDVIENNLVPTEIFSSIHPDYITNESERKYYCVNLGNKEIDNIGFINHITSPDCYYIVSNHLRQQKHNISFWRWIMNSGLKYEYRAKLRKMPILAHLYNSEKDEYVNPDTNVFISNAYHNSNNIESFIFDLTRHTKVPFFVSSLYKMENEDKDWTGLFKSIGISVNTDDLVFRYVLPNLSSYQNTSIVTLLSEHADYIRRELKLGENKSLIEQLKSLQLLCNDGNYRTPEETILSGKYYDFEDLSLKEIVIGNLVSEIYLSEETNDIETIRKIKTLLVSITDAIGIPCSSATLLRNRKIDYFTKNQHFFVNESHYNIVAQIANLYVLDKEGVRNMFKSTNIQLYNTKQEKQSASIMYYGSSYYPECDFMANGIDYLPFVSEKYIEYGSLNSVKAFFSDVLNVSQYFSDSNINLLNNETFAYYFWTDYAPKNKFSLQYICTEDKLSQISCIPTETGNKRPKDLYSTKKQTLVNIVRTLPDGKSKLPSIELPEWIDNIGFRYRLYIADALSYLTLDNHANRREVLNSIIDAPEDKKRNNQHKINKYIEIANWFNGKSKWVPLKDLYALEWGNQTLIAEFGNSPLVCNTSWDMPEGKERYNSVFNLFKVRILTNSDFIQTKEGKCYEEESVKQEISKRLLYLAYINTPNKWKDVFEEQRKHLMSCDITKCESIKYVCKLNTEISTELLCYTEEKNKLWYVGDWDGKRFSRVISWIKYAFELKTDIGTLEKMFDGDFKVYLNRQDRSYSSDFVKYFDLIAEGDTKLKEDKEQQQWANGESFSDEEESAYNKENDKKERPTNNPHEETTQSNNEQKQSQDNTSKESSSNDQDSNSRNSFDNEKMRKTRSDKGQTHERRNHDTTQDKSESADNDTASIDSDNTKEDVETKLKNKWDKKANSGMRKPVSSGRSKGDYDFDFDSTTSQESSTDTEFFNEDRYDSSYSEPSSSKAEQNIKKKNTEARNQAERAEEQLEIYDLWVQTQKYTFLWYKYLMELMYAEKSKSSIRTTKIDFFDNTLINGNKILRLLNPSTVVPSWVENPDNLSIVAFCHGEKTVVKASVVRVDDISVDLLLDDKSNYIEVCSKATMFRLVAENSMGIIDSLNTRFIQLGYEDYFNLEENLPEDIKFIYGPPGTGKTTRLVEILHDIIKNAPKKTNILVLTPTNKAADVIAKRLAAIDDCWACLSRYGATEDTELIEDYGVLTTRDTMDMDSYDNNIVVTTAARYPYDTIQPNDEFICDYPWDYIIVDEASMIDIVTITYILHKGNGAKFYIAGDPKQIRPIEQGNIDVENIYQMLGINELKTAIEDYKRYPLEALTTQYRSVPTIGKIVSEFAYNGLVKTNPNRDPQKPLELDGLNVNTLNFIGFGTKEFDLLYELSAINESAFNLYSAIFTYNMVDYMIKQIGTKYPGKKYSIGVVCPYKAQSEAIKQLLEECPIETEQSPVTCGTVHSFQGDECDIMFVVMNPRSNVSQKSFINNQNIINVAMSRARDYLFFVMPNEKMKGFTVKDRLGKLAGNNRSIMFSHDIEKVMFGDENYIEKNTQITCHMPVNVYYESNAKYEVRINDEALDIQIK